MSNGKVTKGTVIILSAPSGGGKSSIASNLLKNDPNLVLSISTTTRKPRSSEIHGKDYFFVTKEEFKKMLSDGVFLEYAEVYGNFYGTPKQFVEAKLSQGYDVLFDVDCQGAYQIMKLIPSVVSFFIVPPSLEVLRHRLSSRSQDTEEIINMRLKEAETVIMEAINYDYTIINDDFNKACSKISEIIDKHRNGKINEQRQS